MNEIGSIMIKSSVRKTKNYLHQIEFVQVSILNKEYLYENLNTVNKIKLKNNCYKVNCFCSKTAERAVQCIFVVRAPSKCNFDVAFKLESLSTLYQT